MLVYLNKLHAQYPADYYKSLGKVNFYERNFLNAVHALQKAVSIDPTDQESLKLLAVIYDSIGDEQLAQKTRVRSQTLSLSFNRKREAEVPSLRNDLRALGNDFYNRGLYDSALQCYALHLLNNKEDTAAIYFLANSYFYLGDYQQAINNYELLIAKDRSRADAYNLTGVCYRMLNDYIKARDFFRQCLIKDEKFSTAYYNLGEAHFALEDYRLAQFNLEKALAFMPRDKDVLSMLGRVYNLTGQNDKAVTAYLSLYNMDSTNSKTNFELGKVYYEQKNFVKAKQHLASSLTKQNNTEAVALLGMSLYHLKDYKTAMDYLKRAADYFPERKELQYQTASTANHLKRYQLAVQYAQKSIAKDIRYQPALYELAVAYKGLKKRKESKKYLTMANAL